MRKIKERQFTGTKVSGMTQRERFGAEIARRAAAEGIVLLKNENGILPLPAGSEAALYGVGASKTVKGGTGSGDVNQRYCVSIYEGLKAAGYRITTEEWISEYDVLYEKARMAWRDDILSRTEGEKSAHGFLYYQPCGRRRSGPLCEGRRLLSLIAGGAAACGYLQTV